MKGRREKRKIYFFLEREKKKGKEDEVRIFVHGKKGEERGGGG